MKRLAAVIAALAMVGVSPAISLASAAATTGRVRGVVLETSGRTLGVGTRVQLVNSRGAAVPGKTTVVAADGAYTFADVEPGVYTVQVLGGSGSTAVVVTAGRVSTANVTITTAPSTRAPRLNTTARWLIALAAIGGGAAVVAVVATKKDASGSQ